MRNYSFEDLHFLEYEHLSFIGERPVTSARVRRTRGYVLVRRQPSLRQPPGVEIAAHTTSQSATTANVFQGKDTVDFYAVSDYGANSSDCVARDVDVEWAA